MRVEPVTAFRTSSLVEAVMAAVLVTLVVGATIALQAATIGRLSDALNPLTISLSLLASGLIVGSAWAS